MASVTRSKGLVPGAASHARRPSSIASLINNRDEKGTNKRSPEPDVTMGTLVDLMDMIEKPESVHKINTKLFSMSFPQLRCLQELALESTNFEYSSAEYRVTAIILDIANYRLFRPV